MKSIAKKLVIKRVLSLLLGILLLYFSLPLQAQTNFYQKPIPSQPLSENWQYRWEDSPVNSQGITDWAFNKIENRYWNWFKVPGEPPNLRNMKTVLLRVKLPSETWPDPGLLFMTNDQCFQVFLDGKLIYQFGDLTQVLQRSPGSPWHIIPLPSDYQNKLLGFRMKSSFIKATGIIRIAEIGSRQDLLAKLIRNNIDYLILAFIFIFLGFSLIIIFTSKSWDHKTFYALGCSSIFAGIWLVAETPMRQLLFDLPPYLWGYIAIMAFYLMPSGICAFVGRVFSKKYRQVMRKLWQIYILFAFLALFLDLTHVITLQDTLSIFYILLAITMSLIFLVIFDAVRKGDSEARIFGVGILVFGLTGTYHILGWFFRIVPWERYTTHWGLFVFILSLVFILRKRYIGAFTQIRTYAGEIENKNEALKKMWLEVTQSRDLIVEWNKTLEQRVVERTEQLEKANQDLKNALEDLQRTQAQLIESEKMSALGNLVAGIAHEINTPIGVSVTAASHLEQKTAEFLKKYQNNLMKRSDLEKFLETTGEISKIILVNLERSTNLIRSFKQVAVDQSSEQRRRFHFKAYLEEVLLSLKPKLKQTQHHIKIDCPDDLELNSYPGAFSQIITNLILNSLMHAFAKDEAGNIEIIVLKNGSSIQFKYFDNGRGIPPQHIKKIFDPFYTTMRGQGGTGLGLHIVYNIVSQTLKGHIECLSKPGEGTIFVMDIPIEGD